MVRASCVPVAFRYDLNGVHPGSSCPLLQVETGVNFKLYSLLAVSQE
jgi:hypothetical protein